MTYNQVIKLFNDWADTHLLIGTYGSGEEWEINGNFKPGIIDPLFYTIPVNSQVLENTVNRTFKVICFGRVKKDKSNEREVISDTEQICQDFIKFIRYNDADFNLVGEPQFTPFTEEFGDWCAGWEGDIIIETEFDNNECDKPSV